MKEPEKDYNKHRDNPGIPKIALDEKNDEKAGKNINWVILIALAVLVIIFYFIFKDSLSSF